MMVVFEKNSRRPEQTVAYDEDWLVLEELTDSLVYNGTSHDAPLYFSMALL